MARYYFDLWEDDSLLQDSAGVELPNVTVAEEEALRAASAIAEESFRQGRESVTVAVREGDNLVIRMSLRLEVTRT